MYYDELLYEMDLSFYFMSWLMARLAQIWGKKVKRLRERIEEQRPNEVDHVYNEVKDQANRIIMKGESPEEATIEVYGVKIRKIIVHGKSEEYNGADVYLEVENEKFALTQFKLQHNGRYLFDKDQLKNLGKWCKLCVQDKDRPLLCPSFIWLIDDSLGYYKHRILKLCKVKEILKKRNSASILEFERHGITRSAFKELLAKCWVGATFKKKPYMPTLKDYSSLTKRMVVGFFIKLE